MAYESGHIYLVDVEPTGAALQNYTFPVGFRVCNAATNTNYEVTYDKEGRRYLEDSEIIEGIIAIGNVTRNENTLTIGVHPSGMNKWRIKGQTYVSNVSSNILIPPAQPGKFRKDSIVATTGGGFALVKGNEGSVLIEPNLYNSNFIKVLDVLVTPDGFGIAGSDGVMTIGPIVTTASTITVKLHSSGKNTVRINGVEYSRTTESSPFDYTPVTGNNLKSLIIYALPTTQVFYMAEGVAGQEAVEPELPSGALFVRKIIVSHDNQYVDAESLSGFREKAVDGWKTHFASSAAPAYLVLDNSHKCNFSVVQLSSTSEINLAGISSKRLDWLYDGLEFTITNDCATDINLISQVAGSNQKAFILPRSPFKIKFGQSIKLYYSAAQDAILPLLLSSDATIDDIIAGDNITIDKTNPSKPVIKGKNTPTLDEVTKQGNYSSVPITFTTGVDALDGEFGLEPNTWSLYAGGINKSITGEYNTSFGIGCLRLATTATFNTVFGSFALPKITIGRRNSFFGYYSGFSVTTSSHNTSLGISSLQTLTTGNSNIAIGDNSLPDQKTKNNTIGIGKDTGAGGESNHSLYIGSRAGSGNNIDGTLAIHNWSLTQENADNIGAYPSNTVSQMDAPNSLIYGNFINRFLKVNGKFSVNPAHIPSADSTFTKHIVAKPDGTFGWEDKPDDAAAISFATQPEMESQTPPDTENNKAVSLFGLWKWVKKLNYLYLNITTANSTLNKIWYDGLNAWVTNKDGINKQLAYDENGVNIPQGRITTSTNITTETKTNSNLSQNGKNVIIDNGVNNINLTVNAFAGGNFCATYIKDGTGTITIVAGSGVTLDLVQYTEIVNGKSGSRFMISQNGSTNTFKIFVRNYE